MSAQANSSRELLKRLGSGESIPKICASQGWSREEFDAWWRQETTLRNPQCQGKTPACVQADVEIHRDQWGIPHISATIAHDLWFGFGYAMAQDRLFQLDYLRRKGLGRLAEILGPDGVPLDLVARTVGLNRIARAEWDQLPDTTREVLNSFTAGINCWIEACGELLPIEFDLLDYRPEHWSPIDSLAIEVEFRWYLTGRFPVIVMPEMAKRILGNGARYEQFLLGEADEESIIPPEAYAHLRRDLASDVWDRLGELPREMIGQSTGDPEGTGSNNWVIAGQYCQSGSPMVASDPHIAFEAVSCWYEAHLQGPGFNVAGMAYAGMPAIMFGRNEAVAWGITNNICSLRDLYQERTHPDHPGCFQFGDAWEPAQELTETIDVKGAAEIHRVIRFSRSGPIVNEILPLPDQQTGPVALKWLGHFEGGWLTALLAMDQAQSVQEFREALRPWHVPTFNLVIADTAGRIAVQCAGRIPLRKRAERGYRPGWDPEHEWIGLLPFESMPHCVDPKRGWLATANNRLAGSDYPYPLFGTWVSGYRCRRIRNMIESRIAEANGVARQGFELSDHSDMHQDAMSLRAVKCVPLLLKVIANQTHPQIPQAVAYLREWNGQVETDLVAPALFNVFFTLWSKAVTDVYFNGPTSELLAKQAEGVASRLLESDPSNWFESRSREAAICDVFVQTLAYLRERLGDEMSQWTWGRLHRMPLKHVLSARGDLGQLLDHGGGPVKGDLVTVCNTSSGPDWNANSGAGYRLVADLSENGLWAIDGQSQSGNFGSPHYADQFEQWKAGQYHFIPLDPELVKQNVKQTLVLIMK